MRMRPSAREGGARVGHGGGEVRGGGVGELGHLGGGASATAGIAEDDGTSMLHDICYVIHGT